MKLLQTKLTTTKNKTSKLRSLILHIIRSKIICFIESTSLFFISYFIIDDGAIGKICVKNRKFNLFLDISKKSSSFVSIRYSLFIQVSRQTIHF